MRKPYITHSIGLRSTDPKLLVLLTFFKVQFDVFFEFNLVAKTSQVVSLGPASADFATSASSAR